MLSGGVHCPKKCELFCYSEKGRHGESNSHVSTNQYQLRNQNLSGSGSSNRTAPAAVHGSPASYWEMRARIPPRRHIRQLDGVAVHLGGKGSPLTISDRTIRSHALR